MSDKELSEVVDGTTSYRVRLWCEEGSLAYSCSCPVGETETCCKHCVAAGLVWLGTMDRRDGDSDDRVAQAVDVRSHLLSLDKSALVDLLLEAAENDELLSAKLALHAAKSSAQPADLEQYRRAIEAAIVVNDYVDYRSMYSYASNIHEVVSTLGQLLEDGISDEVIALCEYALECVEDALGRVDDSDGELGGIRDDLVELHHEACLLASPDPGPLAERLFDWAIHSEWEIFLDSAERYADVLGETGIARYRALATRVWKQLPAIKDGSERFGSRFRITYIMEMLASVAGSLDELVAIKASDLTHAYSYFQIVELLADSERFADALVWAERGLAAFPERTDVRLVDVAARELYRVGRDAEAMAVVWRHLEESPTAAFHELLRRHGLAAGSWDEWRKRGPQYLRAIEHAARQRRETASARPSASRLAPRFLDMRSESSELVTILLGEHDADAAWEQAQLGGCSPTLWLQPASLRERDHPEDAIPIYQREAERSIETKNNRGYQDGVAFMAKVRDLMDRAGNSQEFASFAAEVRGRHKPKRNLMKLFDQKGW